MATDLNELTKEVYARFGLAYYLSECLHSQLCITYASLGFRSPTDATRPRIEQKMKWAFAQMMGPLIEAIRDQVPPPCAAALSEALRRRNTLAHGFWFEKAHLMTTEEGLRGLDAELQDAATVFETADAQLMKVYEQVRLRVGITDEAVNRSMERLLAGETEPPLPNKRQPKKEERIVRAWTVPLNDRTNTVFETDDGLFLQLCEAGLGWSAHEQSATDWAISEKIQAHLPANIPTRPPASEPWRYNLRINSAILEVSKHTDSNTCSFRLRRPQKSRT